jgi:hypothetical protein
VVEGAYFAGLRVFGVVLLWTKRGDVCGKRGGEAGGFVVAERGTGFGIYFWRPDVRASYCSVPARLTGNDKYEDRQWQIQGSFTAFRMTTVSWAQGFRMTTEGWGRV